MCCSSSPRPAEITCLSCSRAWCPLLPSQLLSFSSINKDFITQLSHLLSSSFKAKKRKIKKTEEKDEELEEREEDQILESREVQSNVEATEVESPR